eukprot:scaffold12.g7957.t1
MRATPRARAATPPRQQEGRRVTCGGLEQGEFSGGGGGRQHPSPPPHPRRPNTSPAPTPKARTTPFRPKPTVSPTASAASPSASSSPRPCPQPAPPTAPARWEELNPRQAQAPLAHPTLDSDLLNLLLRQRRYVDSQRQVQLLRQKLRKLHKRFAKLERRWLQHPVHARGRAGTDPPAPAPLVPQLTLRPEGLPAALALAECGAAQLPALWQAGGSEAAPQGDLTFCLVGGGGASDRPGTPTLHLRASPRSSPRPAAGSGAQQQALPPLYQADSTCDDDPQRRRSSAPGESALARLHLQCAARWGDGQLRRQTDNGRALAALKARRASFRCSMSCGERPGSAGSGD